jgi:hypothetical protein
MAKREIYVSVDIEADGPIPGVNSMLNFGMAAFELGNREPIATFEANLVPLEGAVQDPDTMSWWEGQPKAWEYVTRDPRSPAEVIPEVVAWAKGLPGKPVMVVYPTYDFMWMRWYLVRFGGRAGDRAFGFQALDLKTLMMAVGEIPFKQVSKRWVSKNHRHWFNGTPKHDHTGLADAIGQGVMLINILAELQGVDLDAPTDPRPSDVMYVKDHDADIWHRATDRDGHEVRCGKGIPGSPLICRRNDNWMPKPAERCPKCEVSR